MVHTRKHHRKHHVVAPEAGDTQARPHGIKEIPTEEEMAVINKDKVAWLQKQLIAAGLPLIGGADGLYGDSTQKALLHIAQEAKLNLHSVNFNDPNSANYKTFMAALAMHKQAHDPVITALATGQPLAPPAPAPVVAPPAPAPVVDDPSIPNSIRNTAYDPRNIAKLSNQELNNLIKQGLHGIGEIKGGIFGSYHLNGQLGEVTVEKVKEQQRELLGIPAGAESLDRATLERTAAALGVAVAKRAGLDPRAPEAPVDPRISPAVNGTEYDARVLNRASDAELNNILKDGLRGLGEISGGAFGSYRRDGQLGEVTTAKIFEQERKLLGLRHGEESLDRRTLEAVAAAMGEQVARRQNLTPDMDAALTSARNGGALPPQGTVTGGSATSSVPAPTGTPAPLNILPPGFQPNR